MLEILEDICNGKGRKSDIDLLLEIADTVKNTSLCGLGKTAPNPVITTIKCFKDEHMEHIIGKRYPAGVCKELTTFKIDNDRCTGCDMCRRECPVEAISGIMRSADTYVIDELRCTRCGNCIDTCNHDAVKVLGRVRE